MVQLVLLAAVLSVPRGGTLDANLNVFAAASLKDAFTAIARDYEAEHPSVHVTLTFAGSQTLAAQIDQGAPADVFAAAAPQNLDAAHPDASTVRIFARNRLTIVERTGWNGVHSLKDLSSVPKLVLAADAVPAGRYAAEMLHAAARTYGRAWEQAVESHVVSRELDVRAVLAKVKLGEADAGIVYESDAVSARGQVTDVPIPDALNPLAEYPVGAFTGSPNPDVGRDFIKFLFTAKAQKELSKQGFVSAIEPSPFITVVNGSATKRVAVPLPTRFRRVTLHVVGRNGVRETVTGVSVESVVGPLGKSVTFTASDGYARTLNSSVLGPDMAALVREPDGNYQIVIQGYKPSWWVKWIRRIDVKD